jgi:hypothetical protein
MMYKLNLATVKALQDSGIVQMRGLSGVDVSAEMASQLSGIVQMHAMSGNVYDFTFDGKYFHATGQGIIHADGVSAGQVLRADGTRYIPDTLD